MSVLASLAAATFLFAGCSAVKNSAEKALEKATDCKIDIGEDQASAECKDGGASISAGDSAKIPTGFPDAVPLPDGKLISAFATETADAESYNLSYTFDGSLSNAATDYREGLRADGFTIDDSNSFSAGNGSIAGFSADGHGWKMTVIGGGGDSDDGNSALSVTVVGR